MRATSTYGDATVRWIALLLAASFAVGDVKDSYNKVKRKRPNQRKELALMHASEHEGAVDGDDPFIARDEQAAGLEQWRYRAVVPVNHLLGTGRTEPLER